MLAFGFGVAGLLAFLVGTLYWLRKKRQPMRSLEESAATTWLSFRRIVAFGFAFMLTLGALRNIYLFFALHDFRYILYALFGTTLAFLSYFFGRYVMTQ